MAHNEILVVLHFVQTVLAFREDEAVGLAVHSFGTQGGSDQVNFLILPLLELFRLVEQLNFDARVFLRGNTFALRSVVVSTRLVVKLTEYRVALSMLHLVFFFQSRELPFDVRVKEGVRISSDERATPVGEQTEILQILHANRWEEFNPVERISKSRDLFFSEANLE